MYHNGRDATIGLAPLLILLATVRSNFRGSLLSRNSKAFCGDLYLEHIVRSHAGAGAKGDAIFRGGQRKESKLDFKNIHAVDSNLSQRVESASWLPTYESWQCFAKKPHVSTLPAKIYLWQAGQDSHQSKPTEQTSFSSQCYFTTLQLSLQALLFFAARWRPLPWLAFH